MDVARPADRNVGVPSNCLPEEPPHRPLRYNPRVVSAGEPEFLICLNCETPTYVFEYTNGRLTSATCTACGNDDLNEFMTESELDEQRS